MITVDEASSEFPSAIHAVVFNDDLFIDILLRLPVASLCVFKSVSKRWLNLITSPNFILRRNQSPILEPPFGLFLRHRSYFKYNLVPFVIKSPAKRSPLSTIFPLDSDTGKIKILQSCNGLLLCDIRPDELCVCNPSLNRFKTIHKLPYYSKSISFIDYGSRIAFDPSKSPYYKIVHARAKVVDHPFSLQIHVYSSETSNWSVCGDRFSFSWFRRFDNGIYWNGAIHWLDTEIGPFRFKLDLEPLVLTRVLGQDNQKLFVSHGRLLLLCTDHAKSILIYEMRKRCSWWSLKYALDLDDIMIKFPKTWKQCPTLFCSSVLCIMIGEKDEDSFLVVEIYRKTVRYNIVSKAIFKLNVLRSLRALISFEFIPSLAGV